MEPVFYPESCCSIEGVISEKGGGQISLDAGGNPVSLGGIEGVSVYLQDNNSMVVGLKDISDSTGHYQIPVAPDGVYTIIFEPPDKDGDNYVSHEGDEVEIAVFNVNKTFNIALKILDCDDSDETVFPGAGSKEPNVCGRDSDGDGYVDNEFTGGTDCDDSDKDINPGAEEIPDNGIDDDCKDGDLVTNCSDNKMVNMGTYYIDKYEASRPDATADSVGSINVRACSVSGVLPWVSVNWNDARAACQASSKRLCTKDEWGDSCDGTAGEGGYTYPYGDTYQETTCNGEDAGHGKAMPTGYMSGCTSEDGVYDMSGNVWEWTDELDGNSRVLRGGDWINYSYILACSYRSSKNPTISSNNYGFRCCQDK